MGGDATRFTAQGSPGFDVCLLSDLEACEALRSVSGHQLVVSACVHTGWGWVVSPVACNLSYLGAGYFF